MSVTIIYAPFWLTFSFLSPPILAMERGVFAQARQVLVPLSYISTASMMINDSEMLAVYTRADIQRDSSFTPIILLTQTNSMTLRAGSRAGTTVLTFWKGTHVYSDSPHFPVSPRAFPVWSYWVLALRSSGCQEGRDRRLIKQGHLFLSGECCWIGALPEV